MTIIFSTLKASFLVIIFSISFVICNKMLPAYGESSVMNSELEPTKLELILSRDAIRQHTISRKVVQIQHQKKLRLPNIASTKRKLLWENDGTKNNDLNVSMKMPMRSGADFGIGQYLVGFKAGTPFQRFVLVADTGSDLTWMNCKYGCTHNPYKCSSSSKRSEVFEADNSTSFATIPCSSDMCTTQLANLFSLAMCPSALTPCAYDYRFDSIL